MLYVKYNFLKLKKKYFNIFLKKNILKHIHTTCFTLPTQSNTDS